MHGLSGSLKRNLRAVVALGVVLLVAHPAPALAQYFGRNKVQYESRRFRVLETAHFEVHYYPEMEEAARDAARMAERWYERLARLFQHEFVSRKPIILYADHPDFQQTNAIPDLISEGTGGVTESLKDRVILPLTGLYQETDHVLGHELVHAFQYDVAKARRGGGATAISALPLWLVEGMAEYLSVGRRDPHTAMWMRDAALREELPSIQQLTRDRRFFPYRYGQALWAYVAGRWGDDVVPTLYRRAAERGWAEALSSVLGVGEDSLSREWITATRASYLPLMQGRTHPRDAGTRILAPDIDAGDMNVGPALSADGRRVAFLSTRDIFTVELYVGDAHTGRVLKRLTSSAADPHYDALAFISSAGSWSPDGRRLAFVVYAKGDQALTIVDAESGKVERRVHVPGVGAMSGPAWAPDGKRVAFSGTTGGISDLYVFDLETGNANRLTNDDYADLQPAWSPDGRTIAFVTDRGSATDLGRLTYGPLGLALLDVASGRVRRLDLFPAGKHINPQFSPDGSSLFFISDRDGFSDVYRLALGSGEIFRVTRVATGVSGITALSPALTVAARDGRMMFSVFDGGHYVVNALEPSEARGEPVGRGRVNAVAAELPPPAAAAESFVTSYLEDAATGLPSADSFQVSDYRSSLQLDYVGQPTVGVAVDRFGTAVGGATALFFSDMLGNRNLGIAVQANGGVKDIGGQAVYQDLGHRWNWGLAAGHIPYLIAFTGVGTERIPVNGGSVPVTVVWQLRQRVFVDRGMGMVTYPFSSTRRLEANLGITRYGFDNEVERFYIATSGQLVRRDVQHLDAPDPLSLVEGAVALVGDYAFFGFTSPVRGGRYRLELGATAGTLGFQTALADYRRYLLFRPVTLAARGLHYGRYGADADTDRMNPLFLGFETFVRGYSAESFDASECTGTAGSGACPEFDRLLGSRIAVLNLELRVPLFGVPEFGLISFPYLPTEVGAFFDAGAAWTGADAPQLAFRRRTADRVPVFSTGLTARFNILGFLVVEAYYAYPFQRPDKGWHWGFQVAPGW